MQVALGIVVVDVDVLEAVTGGLNGFRDGLTGDLVVADVQEHVEVVVAAGRDEVEGLADGGETAAGEVLNAEADAGAVGFVGQREGRFAIGGDGRRVGRGGRREVDVGHAEALGFEDSGTDMVHGELTGRL